MDAAGGQDPGADDLALFLRVRASWLCQGLARRRDVSVVRRVLRDCDRSHESWLWWFAELRRRGDADAVEALAELYAYHGRVAGILAGPGAELLAPEIVERAGRVMADELVARTEAAIAVLSPAAGCDPRRPG
jgi:hypothetical protein